MTAQIIHLVRPLPPPQPVVIPITRTLRPRDPWSPRCGDAVVAGGREGICREHRGDGCRMGPALIRYRVVFGPGGAEWFLVSEMRPAPGPEAA